jgi:LmbE family N-acetylglucosaminyl deacetylase
MGNRRMLAIFAHPDDETFGAGGTLAVYARRGVEVHLVCATRGEVGEAPPGWKGFSDAGSMREAELRCAAKILGLSGVHFLGYRDSGMPGSPDNAHPRALAAAPTEQVAREAARYIRQLRPQVVVTFDPIGGYRHPDHIAAHRATVAGFRIAADPRQDPGGGAPYQPQKLYFHTFPHGLLRWAVRLMPLLGVDPRRLGKNRDIDLTAFADVNFPIHARIDIRTVLAVKREAAACHSSQGGAPGGGFGRLGEVLLGATESFMRGYPETPPRRVERDLFAGVDEKI